MHIQVDLSNKNKDHENSEENSDDDNHEDNDDERLFE